MSELNLAEILAQVRTRTSKPSPAQRKERAHRLTMAANMARQAVLTLHKDEYQALYRQAIEMVVAERGPLPD